MTYKIWNITRNKSSREIAGIRESAEIALQKKTQKSEQYEKKAWQDLQIWKCMLRGTTCIFKFQKIQRWEFIMHSFKENLVWDTKLNFAIWYHSNANEKLKQYIYWGPRER